MNKISKFLIPSLILVGLVPSMNSTKSRFGDNSSSIVVTSERTINKDENINVVDKHDKSNLNYDYNYGVSNYSPIGAVEANALESNHIDSQNLYTYNEVEEIVNTLSNDYNQALKGTVTDYDQYIEKTVTEYETYINNLNTEYKNLENAYVDALDVIDYYDANLNKNHTNNKDSNDSTDSKVTNKTETNIKDSTTSNNVDINKNPEPVTTPEQLDSIYNEAINYAAKNVEHFEPIQGQVVNTNENIINPKTNNNKQVIDNKKPETNENKTENTESKPDTNNNGNVQETKDTELNSNVILDYLKTGIKLPSYIEKNAAYITEKYGIGQDKINDYKIITSGTNKNDFFEMLIINTSNINEESLLSAIDFRINGILKEFFENNNIEKEINNKILLVNIDDYVVFCFSNVSQKLMDFLSNN